MGHELQQLPPRESAASPVREVSCDSCHADWIQAEGVLERVAGLADELQLANLQPQIAACRRQLDGNECIDVAVFGRFKAGKSSFLNHLTGRAVLPIGVVPLTAVITRLRYGPVERAEVRFLNGPSRTISLEDIGLYVGENENPNNEKQVSSVEVELPALEEWVPLQFVDTPGLGSALAHNTEVALSWLPNVGAALVAVSADAPLSERDLELLRTLRQHTPKIVLLLTKADLLTKPQQAEVLSYVRRQLQFRRRHQPEEALSESRKSEVRSQTLTSVASSIEPQAVEDELPVFFYSIKPELAGFKSALQTELLEPLLQRRTETAEAIIRHKLDSLVNRTLDYLRVAWAAATQAESARQALRQKLADERRQFELLRSELGVLAHQWSAGALEGYLAELTPTRQALQAKVTAELRRQFPCWKLRLPPLLAVWREWLGRFLEAELADVSQAQNAMFTQPVEKARAHLTRTLRAFQDRLAKHVQSALGVKLSPGEFLLETREPTAPPVDVAFAFDVAFTTAGWLIPLSLFRGPMERALLRQARYEIEKHLSRLAAAWRDRVAQVIHELTRQAEQQACDDLAALEQLLAQTTSGAPARKEAINELQEFQHRLRDLHRPGSFAGRMAK